MWLRSKCVKVKGEKGSSCETRFRLDQLNKQTSGVPDVRAANATLMVRLSKGTNKGQRQKATACWEWRLRSISTRLFI